MKKLSVFLVGIMLLNACQVDEDFISTVTVNPIITSQYLLDGNLDTYLQNNQVFRYTGKPGLQAIPVGIGNLAEYEDCFVLYVASGQNATTAVSSAIIKLDGLEVLSTSDFSNSEVVYTFEICQLMAQSVLEIEVRGEPESCIDIWIEGKKKELTVTDCDGNVYKTIKIGDQIWMAENLRTTQYNDCTPITFCYPIEIPGIPRKLKNNWSIGTPQYCWYNEDKETYGDTYGALYNFGVVNTQKLCPSGWHVPSVEEWQILANNLGGSEVAGGKMKTTGTIENGDGLWYSPNTGATNESGFNAVPSGLIDEHGWSFAGLGITAQWWTSNSDYLAPSTSIANCHEFLGLGGGIPQRHGLAVRCVKD